MVKRSCKMVDQYVANITRKEPYDVYIGRPGKGQSGGYGNPFVIGKHGKDAAEVVRKYELWLLERPGLIAKAQRELKGKVLGCFCKGEHVCHGHVLAFWANLPELLKEHGEIELPAYVRRQQA